ncbi:MAG: ComEC/Rec2 family competence protein [Oscillospiraceae bacterium]|nr:ComEC/Rec2 family competence protein [Oscillospiraceae bacterium]
MASLAVYVSITGHNALWDLYETVADQDITLTGRSVSGTADEGILIRDALLTWESGETSASVILYGTDDLWILPGETFSVRASVQGLASPSQQGKGAQLSLWADASSLSVSAEQPFFYRLRSQLLDRMAFNLRRSITDSDSAALVTAMLTGDDGDIPDRVYSLYQRSGIAHILCISGLHLSILSAVILAALTFIGRRPALFLTILVTAGYVWLTGMGPSSVRAWIMTCLVMIAELFYRDSAPLNSLGLAVLLLTLYEPALVCRMGFLLSVTSVLAITALAPSWKSAAVRLLSWEEKSLPAKFIDIPLSSAAVSLLTLPILMIFTGYTPLLSPLFNMIVLPLMPVLLACELISSLTGCHFTGILCQKILALFEWTAQLGAEAPVLPLSGIVLIGIAGCILMAAIVFLLKGRDYTRAAAGLLSLIVLCVTGVLDDLSRENELCITQYTLSRGSSIVLQSGSRAILIGTGDGAYEGRQLTSALLAGGVSRIDALIIPADRLAYTGGSYSILTALGADTVLSPSSSRVMQALDHGSFETALPLSDSLWQLFDGGTLQVHTGADSAVLTLDWNNKQILLNESGDPVPWPADIRLIYDKKAEEPDTTRKNYAIMVSSGLRLRPAAELVLPDPEKSTRKERSDGPLR